MRSKPSAKGLSILTGAPLLPDVVCRTSQGDKCDDVAGVILQISRLMKDVALGAERLENECAVMRWLQHPNIIQLQASFEDEQCGAAGGDGLEAWVALAFSRYPL